MAPTEDKQHKSRGISVSRLILPRYFAFIRCLSVPIRNGFICLEAHHTKPAELSISLLCVRLCLDCFQNTPRSCNRPNLCFFYAQQTPNSKRCLPSWNPTATRSRCMLSQPGIIVTLTRDRTTFSLSSAFHGRLLLLSLWKAREPSLLPLWTSAPAYLRRSICGKPVCLLERKLHNKRKCHPASSSPPHSISSVTLFSR